jgi:hypothetical protein
MQFSVSLLEKTDAQILYVSGRVVPEADPGSKKVGGELRRRRTFVLIN